ncbi:MAG TPA: iron ABC transporter permease [Candidatus Limnocylindria bacterium]|nr:iron ABC transporter permease [Candidatus Limnocylindria bacterium]
MALSQPAARPLAARRRPGLPPARLLVPALVVAALAALPIAYLLLRALQVDPGSLDLVLRPRTAQILLASLGLGLAVGIGSVLLGLPLAWLTARTDLPARRLWTVLTVVPLAVPSYVMAFALVAALGPRGALSELLRSAGLPGLPSIYGFYGAVLVLTLATYPYVLLSVRGALLRSDPAIEEAGRALGDSPLTVFRRLTLPLLLPATAAGALLAVLYALADFGAVAILQFDSFARAIYIQYRSSFDRSLAAILALMLVGTTFFVAWLESRVRRRLANVPQPVRRPAQLVRLGRWRWPSLAFCTAVVTLALIVPAGTIMFWLVRGLAQGEPLRILGEAAGNSLLAGSLAAGVVALMVLPVAFLSVRHPGFLSGWIERVLYGAYAVPGIVLALATVVFVLNVAPLLYQSLLVLVLAYAVRFLPQALGPARASLVQVGPRLIEAARTLGQTEAGAFRTVTLPLLRPGLVAGMALVFLTTVKELPITLLVGPTGFGTLATAIWGAATEGFYARAAAPAAMLMLLSAATVALLFRHEEPVR